MGAPTATVPVTACPWIAGYVVVSGTSFAAQPVRGLGSYGLAGSFQTSTLISGATGTLPAYMTIAAGDLMLAWVIFSHSNPASVSIPGWTVLDTLTDGGGQAAIYVCSKIATGTDATNADTPPGTVTTVTFASTTIRTASFLIGIPGGSVAAHAITNNPSPPAVSPTVMTPPTPSAGGLAFYYYSQGTTNDEPAVTTSATLAQLAQGTQCTIVYGNTAGGWLIGDPSAGSTFPTSWHVSGSNCSDTKVTEPRRRVWVPGWRRPARVPCLV